VNRFTALYDACVLFPANLRSLLMWLAVENVFRAKWSDDIHEEWMRNAVASYPDFTREKAEKVRDQMNLHVEECLVTDFHSLIPSLVLPDPDDRHVLAAAIVGRADVIVTFNLVDFPEPALEPFGIEVQHPDDFVTHVFDLFPEAACHAVKCHRASMKKRSRTAEEYAEMVERVGLPKTAAEVRRFADII
jgi:predicted nucleic acid-binding protein